MKKIYMSPVMDVIEIKMNQSILTGSDFGNPLSGDEAVAPEFGNELPSVGNLLPFEGSSFLFE